ncbi:MAG: hypothetical protein LBG74_01480 [Spirochaetaceae bacterium]|jgi:hypothetical protein|nr:hypothetical protein [Spirochaetaceae bacterium]
MKSFWNFFWFSVSVALGLTFIGGCALALYTASAGAFYQTIRLVFTIGSGICGIAALVIVPVELFIEDKKARRASL